MFNSCRDICHHRRGSLNPSTIREQMLYLCATRLDIDRQKLAFTKDFDDADGITDLVDEANVLELDGEDINYISDDEQSNDDQLVDISDPYLRSLDTDYHNVQPPSQSSGRASKRPYQDNNTDEDRAANDGIDNADSDTSSDDMLPQSFPKRSKRRTKPPIQPAGFEPLQ